MKSSLHWIEYHNPDSVEHYTFPGHCFKAACGDFNLNIIENFRMGQWIFEQPSIRKSICLFVSRLSRPQLKSILKRMLWSSMWLRFHCVWNILGKAMEYLSIWPYWLAKWTTLHAYEHRTCFTRLPLLLWGGQERWAKRRKQRKSNGQTVKTLSDVSSRPETLSST